LDSAAFGRFQLPATDLNGFLATLPKTTLIHQRSGESTVLHHKMTDGWWEPERLNNPRVAEWSEPGFSGNLLFGEVNDQKQITIYFFNFTT
jgi:hypothetical protein